MHMIPVTSSNLSSIGYENDTLYIRFHDGSLYSYSDVPFSVYQNLLSAPSHGEYFHAHIKKNYAYRKIG